MHNGYLGIVSRFKGPNQELEPYTKKGDLYIPSFYNDGGFNFTYYMKVPHDVLKEALEYKEEGDK